MTEVVSVLFFFQSQCFDPLVLRNPGPCLLKGLKDFFLTQCLEIQSTLTDSTSEQAVANWLAMTLFANRSLDDFPSYPCSPS